jgi:Spy/CpxP family protein refolding chaperone
MEGVQVKRQLLVIASIAIISMSALRSEALRTEAVQPPRVTATRGELAETEMLNDALAVPSPVPRGPQELISDYEVGMASISQQLSASLAAIVQAVQKGELSREEGENISAEQYETARMQFELLSALREILQQDVARVTIAPPTPTVAKQSEIVMVELPFSSMELSPSLAQYLNLSSEQISAIEKLMTEERQKLEPLMAQMQANKSKLLAASGHRETNEKEIKALAATQAGMLTELIIANSRMQAKLCKLLTAEQQQKLDTLKRSSESSLRAGD